MFYKVPFIDMLNPNIGGKLHIANIHDVRAALAMSGISVREYPLVKDGKTKLCNLSCIIGLTIKT